MPLKYIPYKAAYDLKAEDFNKLFCCRCKGEAKCSKSLTAMKICWVNIEVGIWDRDCRKQELALRKRKVHAQGRGGDRQKKMADSLSELRKFKCLR